MYKAGVKRALDLFARVYTNASLKQVIRGVCQAIGCVPNMQQL